MYDARYVSWIQGTHPEDNSEKLLNFFPDAPTDILSLPIITNTDAVDDAAKLNSCSVSISSCVLHKMLHHQPTSVQNQLVAHMHCLIRGTC